MGGTLNCLLYNLLPKEYYKKIKIFIQRIVNEKINSSQCGQPGFCL